MSDERLVDEFVRKHPRLSYEALAKGAKFYLCRETWFYIVLTWAKHDAEQAV